MCKNMHVKTHHPGGSLGDVFLHVFKDVTDIRPVVLLFDKTLNTTLTTKKN